MYDGAYWGVGESVGVEDCGCGFDSAQSQLR